MKKKEPYGAYIVAVARDGLVLTPTDVKPLGKK